MIPLLGHAATLTIATAVAPLVFASTQGPGLPVGYRIAFESVRAIGSEGGRTRVTVYNAGSVQRQLLSTLARRTWEVSPVPGALIDQRYPGIPAAADVVAQAGHGVLVGGYPGLIGEIGTGSITKTEDKRSGATWTTRIDMQDGAVQRSNAVANKSFPPGTPITVILAYLGGISGAVPAYLTPTLADVEISEYTAAGRARDEIRELIEGAAASFVPVPGLDGTAGAYDWWIEQGKLFVIDQRTTLAIPPLTISQVPLPGAATLIERPEPLDGGRYKCVCRLCPFAELGQPAAVIDSIDKIASWRIDEIKHAGDTEGSAWRTELTLSSLL